MVIQTHIVMMLRAHEVNELSIKNAIVIIVVSIGSRCSGSGCTLTTIVMGSTNAQVERGRRWVVLLGARIVAVLNLGFLELLHHHHHLLLLRA